MILFCLELCGVLDEAQLSGFDVKADLEALSCLDTAGLLLYSL